VRPAFLFDQRQMRFELLPQVVVETGSANRLLLPLCESERSIDGLGEEHPSLLFGVELPPPR
jgi:hypothetical protein